VTSNPPCYVVDPDFHDGYIKRYTVTFEGVVWVEAHSPIGMMLYALSDVDSGTAPLRRYDFINWYYDEPDEIESKAYLRIMAHGFSFAEAEQ
jgi:hypothetical protein